MAEATSAEPAGKLEAVVVRGLREGAFWLLAMVALVLLLALASYDPADSGFSYTGEPGRVGNLIGPVGAWMADLLYMMFGGPALLFPLLVGFSGWLAFRAKGEENTPARATVVWRTAGFLLALLSSCGLATLHFPPGVLPSGAGGVLGSLVGDSLAGALSLLGATLFLLALWFAAVQLSSGMSWLTVMDFLGHWTLTGIARLRGRMSSARDQAAGREVREQREAVLSRSRRRPRRARRRASRRPRRPSSRRASASRRRSRRRCSRSRPRRTCRRSSCSTIRARASPATRRTRSRPCRASWN